VTTAQINRLLNHLAEWGRVSRQAPDIATALLAAAKRKALAERLTRDFPVDELTPARIERDRLTDRIRAAKRGGDEDSVYDIMDLRDAQDEYIEGLVDDLCGSEEDDGKDTVPAATRARWDAEDRYFDTRDDGRDL
jgi:hypothetical protein